MTISETSWNALGYTGFGEGVQIDLLRSKGTPEPALGAILQGHLNHGLLRLARPDLLQVLIGRPAYR